LKYRDDELNRSLEANKLETEADVEMRARIDKMIEALQELLHISQQCLVKRSAGVTAFHYRIDIIRPRLLTPSYSFVSGFRWTSYKILEYNNAPCGQCQGNDFELIPTVKMEASRRGPIWERIFVDL